MQGLHAVIPFLFTSQIISTLALPPRAPRDLSIVGVNSTNPNEDAFEAIVRDGFRHIQADLSEWTTYVVTGTPYEGRAWNPPDFGHIVIAARDTQTSGLIREENVAQMQPARWVQTREPSFPPASRFSTWAPSEWTMTLEAAIRKIKRAGYRGPWRGVKVLKFKINPFHESRSELYFAFRTLRTDVSEWIFVGMGRQMAHQLWINLDDTNSLGNSTDSVQLS